MICICGRDYSSRTNFPVRCGCGNKVGRIPQPNAVANKFANAKGTIGFVASCYMPIGGTETWHQSLLPRLRGVNGFVSLDRDMSTGDMTKLGCPTDVGLRAAQYLAQQCKVMVVWNVGNRLYDIIAGTNCKVVSVSHCGPVEQWNAQGLHEQAKGTHQIVSVCNDSIPSDLSHIPSMVIHNAPDPNRIALVNRITKPNRKLAISVSRFSNEKRLGFLADLFRHHLPDWELWLIGAKSGIGSAIVEPSDNVKVMEATQTPGDYYAIADLFVQASINEGYGLSAAEALLSGLPVVSTPVGLFRDRPELATIVSHDATYTTWESAVRNAEPKPIDDLQSIDQWVKIWQELLDALTPIGHRKMNICRSNKCGNYDAGKDACTILTDKGKAGAIKYLATHPRTKCVDSCDHFDFTD